MKTSFSALLSSFKAVSALEANEENHIKSITLGTSGFTTVGSPESQKYMSEPRPCDEALKAFLNACPDKVVYALTALMYAGRDSEPDPVALWSDLKNTIRSKQDACRTLAEKSPRVEYIDKALSNLPAGMKVDDLPNML